MARPKKQVPSYRLHKQSGQAVVTVTLNGVRKDILLGKYGSAESKEEYARVLARLRTPSGSHTLTPAPSGVPADLTVSELILRYAKWCHGFYRATDTNPNRSGTSPRYALRKVRELYGPLPAAEFGPKCLKAVCEAWVADGMSRKVVNGRTGAVKRLFRWAVSEEYVGAEVYQRLQTVEGLRVGRTEAPDRPPVRPAVWADVERALPHSFTGFLLRRAGWGRFRAFYRDRGLTPGSLPGRFEKHYGLELEAAGRLWFGQLPGCTLTDPPYAGWVWTRSPTAALRAGAYSAYPAARTHHVAARSWAGPATWRPGKHEISESAVSKRTGPYPPEFRYVRFNI